ncbi:hypothetical protein BU25DRAFT_486408 [Macroventuria anomochaeta]|uniref:Uncharacterized protein n=1 Tax=Macroventuria anomochaeta TaxID=301207 RepID=A0ACB6SG06_9PLEO|nr:uncharacterized protein BU25DRAFT_486408 [Macroventuria anomochaeta]KAF2633261.1 hypothetical protein BU25DRAFT_486408 [Macroventuria anomochaeta]
MSATSSYGLGADSASSNTACLKVHKSSMYGGIYKQDDVVGQYLAPRAAQRAITDDLQASRSNYVNGYAGYTFQGHQTGLFRDSYTYGNTGFNRYYPDSENIRRLHTLHSLLPHIQPERKLNAFNGLELDIVEGHTGNIFCRAVPKKMLILFLGREIVSIFLNTIQSPDNSTWTGPHTQQNLVLPNGVVSAAAITILVSWVTRACKFATMHTMMLRRGPL